MPKRARLAIVAGVALCCLGARAQSTVSLSAVMSAYDAGDRDVVAKTLRTPADVRAFMKSFDQAKLLPDLQDPKRAVFWMDVAIATAELTPGSDVVKILSAGRGPARCSSDRLQAFERLWHQTALALLQRIKRPDLQQKYLASLEDRYLIKLNTAAISRPYGHFVLDRAIATEQACWLSEFPVKYDTVGRVTTTLIVDTPRLTSVSPDEALRLPPECRSAVSQFDRAAAFADVAAEAGIRSAVGRFKLGRFDDALASLGQVRVDGTDAVRDYWSALVTARTLHQLKRLPDAERAYRAAWTLWPEARAPGTGLALVLVDLNRRDEALATAEAVYALPLAPNDPWWAYATADARFVRSWRDRLLEMAK